MSRGRSILAIAALMLSPLVARAGGECKTLTIYQTDGTTAFSAVDISGGAVTSGVFAVAWGANVTLRLDLTDASNEVSNIRLTFREYASNISSPQARTIPDCDKAAGVWTCNQLKIDWNPQTSGNGKNYVMPVPIAYRYIDFTATPTGHGASDTLTVTAEVCY